MSKLINVHYNNKSIYDIAIENSFDKLRDRLTDLDLSSHRVCIVTDTNVGPHHLADVYSIFKDTAKEVISFSFDAGEHSKTLDTVKALYEALILNGFDRKDMLVALGGGVVGDLTGYTAATYLRGIDFIQIPTSLLSQVDSSIGGKTGVDFDSYKNMVGAFHQPSLVYINLNTLNTLPKRQFLSGMGEIIKHGLIKDKDYFYWLDNHADEICNMDMNILEEMIYVSCNIKRNVVENDPKEKGERALLNFGHTIGHSVEKLMNFKLLHGECVAIGSVIASKLSENRNLISNDEYVEIKSLFEKFQLPVSIDSKLSLSDVITTTHSDKKMESGQIKFILLDEIGHAFIDKTINDIEMLNACEVNSVKNHLDS